MAGTFCPDWIFNLSVARTAYEFIISDLPIKSYAKKYSLGNLFLIDDTKDDDAGTKPELKGEALEKAKKFLAEGGKLEAIKSKYKIPAATLKTL